jgi:hypothetical protein
MLCWVAVRLCTRCTTTYTDTSSDLCSQPLSLANLTSPITNPSTLSPNTSFNNTITSTLSLISVLFEGLFEAITIHKEFCGKKMDPKPSISLPNKTDTFDRYDFTINIFEDEVDALQKESLMLFEAHCVFDYREFYKKCFVF